MELEMRQRMAGWVLDMMFIMFIMFIMDSTEIHPDMLRCPVLDCTEVGATGSRARYSEASKQA